MNTIRSLPIDDTSVSHACITNNPKWGYGVFSWHNNWKDAQHNANITNGIAVIVSRINGDIVLPHAARQAVDNFLGFGDYNED